MNYELCKQLKDAGFPQECDFGDKYFTLNREVYDYYSDGDYGFPNQDEILFRIPTLSELIEACGKEIYDEFNEMKVYFVLGFQEDSWSAGYFRDVSCLIITGSSDFYSIGSTPEEAVAKLWLKLNEK